MKSAKILAMAALFTLAGLSGASAGERTYDPSMPRWAVQQHEQYAKSLEHAAARKAKAAQAQASASTNDAGPAAAAAGIIAVIALLAAL